MSDRNITTAQAAKRLGLSEQRIRVLAKRLGGKKIGRDWLFTARGLDKYDPLPPYGAKKA